MKIGIITQPLVANYGGILQNYALQQVLKSMGHEVWTIDYGRYTWLSWANKAWKILVLKLLGRHVKFGMSPKEWRQMERHLRKFVDEHISTTIPRTRKLERNIVQKYDFDALVVGSDQIWRPMYNDSIKRAFLSFTKGIDIKRIAYASSFGTDKWEFTNKQTTICGKLAKIFDKVSMREESGVELCREYLGVTSDHVLDPTFLLKAEDYNALCKGVPKRKPFLFAYILDKNEEKRKSINSFAERQGLPCVIKSANDSLTDADSIESWLSCFRDASFVITDSFHGTAFSINFNKEFYVFGNHTRGNSRFESLLQGFDLEDRMVKSIPQNSKPINWVEVNKKLNSMVDFSIEWLKNALK